MAEQDRSRWDADAIAEGVALITDALPRGAGRARTSCRRRSPPCTTRRRRPRTTDWAQIVALYEALLRLADNPVVRLNHAVAVAMADGSAAGLERLAALDGDPRIAGDHRLHAARAHLLELSGDHEEAHAAYLEAARRANSLPQQRYLNARAERLRNH